MIPATMVAIDKVYMIVSVKSCSSVKSLKTLTTIQDMPLKIISVLCHWRMRVLSKVAEKYESTFMYLMTNNMNKLTTMCNFIEIRYWGNHCQYWLDAYYRYVTRLSLYQLYPGINWENEISEFDQWSILIMFSPIRLHFGQFRKNTCNAEKD